MLLFTFPTIFLTAISTAVFVFTVIFTNPKDSSGNLIVINLVYFFLSGFFSLAGILTLVLYWLSNLRSPEVRQTSIESLHKPKIRFLKSLRHGVLVSSVVVGIGLLNSLEFNSPLNVILLITAAVLIELYFFGH